EKKTQNKKVRNRKVQVKALTYEKPDHLDDDEMSNSDPVPNSEENVLTSPSRKSTHIGKTKKDALRQDSPNRKKSTSWKPEAEELKFSWIGLETKPSGEEQCKTRMLPSEDLPMPSSGHQEEQTVSLKKSLKSSKKLQLASEVSQHLGKKKETAKQKLPKAKTAKSGTNKRKNKTSVQKGSNKKPQLQRQESSDREPQEEEFEREPGGLNEVCTTPLHQKLESPTVQKLTKSKKPKNVLDTPESPGGANNTTPLKALQHPVENVKNPAKKRLSAKSSGKIPKKIPRRTNKALCSSSEDTESQTDSDSSSLQDMAREKQKLSDVKIKSCKRKHSKQRGPQHVQAGVFFFLCSESVQEDGDKFAFSTKSPEQDDIASDNSEDLNYKLRHLFSDIAVDKIVMPSNTPNVRRSKRIRLRPLEYWRGERINYAMEPSGGLVMSGPVQPETGSPRKSKRREDCPKQKRDKTSRKEIPESLYCTLADASKPATVVDLVTNEEVHIDCINTGRRQAYFFKDEAIEIHKSLNTSLFATGKMILKPYKEKGHQFVDMDTIAFHIIRGKVIVTLHKTSYYLTSGDCFYVPAGNGYNIRNLLNEECILLFTQLKDSARTPMATELCSVS
ncbi:CENPC protein, partial [Irena cyanogastra]|nr:CENPC protein [Irena cyanogastra]